MRYERKLTRLFLVIATNLLLHEIFDHATDVSGPYFDGHVTCRTDSALADPNLDIKERVTGVQERVKAETPTKP